MRLSVMICTEWYDRVSELSDSLWCVEQKTRAHFLFGSYLVIPILLMFTTLPSDALDKTGDDTSKPFRVFEKIPEHNKEHLYDNGDWSHDGKK